MTVAELIARLQTMDPTKEVTVVDYGDIYFVPVMMVTETANAVELTGQ